MTTPEIRPSLHPSEGSDSWCTPKWLCDLLGAWDLDPCSNDRSHVRAARRIALPEDGLLADWTRDDGAPASTYVNPPYSNVMPWARGLARHDGPWCALLKLDPTTRWWGELMTAHPTVAMFRRRIRFETDSGAGMTANFPSVLVYRRWEPCAELRSLLWLPSYAQSQQPASARPVPSTGAARRRKSAA